MKPTLVVLIGYAVSILGGDFFVRFICQKMGFPKGEKTGLVKAGRIIGYLERFIIFTFFLDGSYEAIAFVFTGKSIIRLADKEESEYYLIGTLASIAWTIFWGVLLKLVSKINL